MCLQEPFKVCYFIFSPFPSFNASNCSYINTPFPALHAVYLLTFCNPNDLVDQFFFFFIYIVLKDLCTNFVFKFCKNCSSLVSNALKCWNVLKYYPIETKIHNCEFLFIIVSTHQGVHSNRRGSNVMASEQIAVSAAGWKRCSAEKIASVDMELICWKLILFSPNWRI
jgi:hypothetical protein